MNKVIIHGSNLTHERTVDQFAPSDRTVTYEISGDMRSPSDGYHTFDELYEHRHALFIALCREISSLRTIPHIVWRSERHADGSTYDGWFILGIDKQNGSQISYHFPMSKWKDTSFAETLERAPEWDGHTPADVINRLKNL